MDDQGLVLDRERDTSLCYNVWDPNALGIKLPEV
jgi:hypothetical protein